MANLINQRSQYLISKYAKRIAMVEKVQGKPMTFEKKVALAHCLENTSSRIKAMEATNPAQIGQYKRYALDILTASVPNLIAFDVVAVQPMDNRVGMINYLNYKYQSNKGETKAGTTFLNSLNGSFSDTYYTSAFVNREEVGTGDGSNKVFNLSWTPVDISKDEQGNYKAVVVDEDGTAYTIKANGLTATSVEVTTAPTSGKKVYVSYYFLNEDVRSNGFDTFGTAGETASGTEGDGAVGGAGFTNVPEIGLEMQSLPIIAVARTLRAYWAFDASYELQKEYGQNIEELLATQASGEMAYEIDNEITFDLLKSAVGNTNPLLYTRTWSKAQPVGVSLADHYDGFIEKINDGSNAVAGATRKVSANFMICGLGVKTVLESMRNFKPSGNVANGSYYCGMIGNIKVYVNPAFPQDKYVMGYKGSTMFDAGYFYCPYMPITATDLIMDADFRGQRAWATMYGKKMVNPDLYVAGQITA